MSIERHVHASYLRDLGCLIKELAIEAKQVKDSAGEAEDRAYAIGRLMALHEVISIEGARLPPDRRDGCSLPCGSGLGKATAPWPADGSGGPTRDYGTRPRPVLPRRRGRESV